MRNNYKQAPAADVFIDSGHQHTYNSIDGQPLKSRLPDKIFKQNQLKIKRS